MSNPYLYDPRGERDACGIGFVADAKGTARRDIVEAALNALCRVVHRGAVASDALTGDGAGILAPIPKEIFDDRAVAMCEAVRTVASLNATSLRGASAARVSPASLASAALRRNM